jgi:hypothetical protein
MSDGLPKSDAEPVIPQNADEVDPQPDTELPVGDVDRLEEDLLIQTAQVVQQVRRQIGDVARRETALTAQLKQLDQERRTLRLDQQNFQAETLETRESLKQRRAELAVESDELRRQKADRVSQQESLAGERQQLEADRETLRQDVQRELDERSGELHAEKMVLSQRRIEFENEIDESRQSMQGELQAARIELEREINEAALSAELRAKQEQFECERERFQQTIDGWHQKIELEEAQRRIERERLVETQTKAEHELDELRRATWREFEDEYAQHQKQMLIDRRRAEEQIDAKAIDLKKQQALKESSLRFQEDHLNRLRSEVEQAQESFRFEYQKSRQRLEDLVDLQRRRSRQLDHRYNILAQFADSLYRQQEALARLQQSTEQGRHRERERLASERQALKLHEQTQQSENRRQSDMVTMHAENLDKRRDRLDKLRGELEERHRELLQTQMAVDEAWAQLAQVTGDETAENRIAEAREKLSDHYAQLRVGLNSQRREVDESREQLESQKEAFRAERQGQTDWVAQQGEQLRRHEEQLESQFAQLEQQESNHRLAQDSWLCERLEAERIIRELLAELTEKNTDGPDETSTPNLPDMPGLLGLSRFLDNAA